MDEFEVIKRIFRPLAAKKKFSLDLNDDAAILNIKKKKIVVATDSIVEGDHFERNEKNPSLIAKKLLRVNISDMAAMGAKAVSYTLNLSVPQILNKKKKILWIKSFAKGLREDQKKYNIHLLGGDTVATYGKLIMSLNLYGYVKKKILTRSGACIGDDIYVTGNIGDSGIGYGILMNRIKGVNNNHKNFYINKHKIPNPPINFGEKAANFISAATDISDGLLADLNNIINASRCGAEIYVDKIPFIRKTKLLLKKKKITIDYLLSCGEDYQLIFTANKKFSRKIFNLSKRNSVKVVKIGKITKTKKLKVLNLMKKELFFKTLGFKHF